MFSRRILSNQMKCWANLDSKSKEKRNTLDQVGFRRPRGPSHKPDFTFPQGPAAALRTPRVSWDCIGGRLLVYPAVPHTKKCRTDGELGGVVVVVVVKHTSNGISENLENRTQSTIDKHSKSHADWNLGTGITPSPSSFPEAPVTWGSTPRASSFRPKGKPARLRSDTA